MTFEVSENATSMQKHKRELLFYMDDSGSRDPDRKPNLKNHEPNWFALGGVVVDSVSKREIEASFDDFRNRWSLPNDTPLRSYNIRNRTDGFRWLNKLDSGKLEEFFSDLTQLIISSPIIVLACVVDRPGYNARYAPQYGQRRWSLCKTAFNIAVERAAKLALEREARMRVFVERSDPKTEDHMKGYFDHMRSHGLPFDGGTSAKYKPLEQAQLKHALLEFSVRTKSSTLMQLADLVLWPVCRGGYHPDDRAFRQLVENKKLLDALCTESNGLFGNKYFCFPPS